jgi:hypothetical protein
LSGLPAHSGARRKRVDWLLRWKFLTLFVTLLLIVVAYPVLRDIFQTRLVFDVVFTLVFLGGVLAVFSNRRSRILAFVLGAPTVLGVWSGYVLPSLPRLPMIVAFHLTAVLFFAFIIISVLKSLSREVTSDGIYGAFCGYLLLGIIFGHVFCVVETLVPGSFQASAGMPSHSPNDDRLHAFLTYFSFMTLTTIGYGDIVPLSQAARALVVVEAVLGQFYIVVVMAELIGMRMSHALSDRNSESHR